MTPPAVTVVGDVVDLRDDAVVVRDQAAVRLAGAGAAHQGAGRRAVGAAARLTARCPRRCRPSRSSRRATRSRWTRPIRGLVEGRYEWIAFTSVNAVQGGAREVRGVRPRRPRLLRPQDRRGRRQDRRGDRGLGHPRRPGAVRRAVRRAGCSRTGRPTTTCSTRSTGSSCRAPTSPPRPWSPVWSTSAGRSTTSRPTARCGPRRRRRRSARRSRPASSTRWCSPRPRPCATWSASPASRTRRRSSRCIGPATAKTAEEHGLRVDVLAPSAVGRGAGRRARRVRCRARGSALLEAGEPVTRPSERRPVGAAARPALTMSAGFPDVRPRRLRRTPALRRLVAETRVRAAPAGAADVRRARAPPSRRRSARMPGVVQHTRDSLRKAAAEAAAARARRRDAVRRPEHKDAARHRGRSTPTASSTSRSPTCVAEVGDELPVMADLCLDEFTDHGHCGVLDRRRRGRQRRDPGDLRRDGARAGRRRRRRGRPERDDGRPGRRDPRGARRRRAPRRR